MRICLLARRRQQIARLGQKRVGEHQITRVILHGGGDDRRRPVPPACRRPSRPCRRAVVPPPKSARASECRTGGTARKASGEFRLLKPARSRSPAQASHWPASSSITHSEGSSRPVARTWSPQAQMPMTKASRLATSTARPPPLTRDHDRERHRDDAHHRARGDGEIADAQNRGDDGGNSHDFILARSLGC